MDSARADSPRSEGLPAQDGAAIDVSVIIVHYRRPELLARCLETIAQSRTSARTEVLIVDNDPLDDAGGRLAALHGARYLRNERNLGYGRAINQGIAAARGRHFLILNPDIEVKPGSIDALVAHMDGHPEAGIAGPKLFSPDGSLQYSARTFYTLPVILLRRTPLGRLSPNARVVREHLMMEWDHAGTREVDWLIGGAILVRREAVDDVGGMDERFFLYFEDVDWCSRMHRRGWQVVYVPAAEMIHAHQRASVGGFLTRGQRIHLESALRFYEKWSLVLYLWKRHATTLRAAATLTADVVLLSIAFLAAYFTRYLLGMLIPGWSEAKPVFALQVYSRFIPFADLVAVGIFSFLGLYRGEVWRDRWREFLQLAKGILLTSLVVLAVTYLSTTRPLSRFTVLIFFPYALLGVGLGRALLRRLVAGMRERRIQLRRLAVFAPRARIAELKRRFETHGTFGYEPIYLAHEETQERTEALGGRRTEGGGDAGAAGGGAKAGGLGERQVRLLVEERIAEVVLFDSPDHAALVARLLPRLLASGLPVTYVPPAERHLHAGVRVRDFMGFGGLCLGRTAPRVHGWGKRAADLVLTCVLLVVGLPFHLLQALHSGGRVIAWTTRIGRAGREIQVPLYAAETKLLRALPLLRGYPLLVQVLSGEMSLVGLIPLTLGQWQAAGEEYRLDPPDAPAGILPAWGIPGRFAGYASQQPEEALAWNQAYVNRSGPGEDLRIAAHSLFGRDAAEEL